MQDCSKYDIMINARIDGTLNKKDARELDRHLASCADCRKYLQLLEDIRDGLHEDLPDPPEALREGVMRQIGLEKHRKLHLGAMGRWAAIAAVLCVVIFGVVKLTGSGVMRRSAMSNAAPEMLTSLGDRAIADGVQESEEESGWLNNSKMAAPAAPAQDAGEWEAPSAASAGGSANSADPDYDASPVNEALETEPMPGSVYLADSLPGYGPAVAAMEGGEYWGVCVFYGGLPEGVGSGNWQTKIPEDGEKERWLLSAEELQALETGAAWDEFYYGDRSAGQGLVIVIAGEEE